MKVLGIDCSTQWICLGLSSSGEIVGEYNVRAGRGQSSLLAPLVGQLMSSCRVGLSSLDSIAVTSGPGLFTGIRVGLSYSCGLAEGLDIPIVTVDSLSVLGNPFLDGDKVVVPLLRARKGSVYFNVLAGIRNSPSILVPPEVLEIRSLMERLDLFGRYDLVPNDDGPLLEDLAEEGLECRIRSSSRGATVAFLGSLMRDKAISPSEARALYLRSPDIGP